MLREEGKREAGRLLPEGQQSLAHVVRDVGLRATILGRGKTAAAQHQDAAFPGIGQLQPDETELRQLRRENERLRMDRDL